MGDASDPMAATEVESKPRGARSDAPTRIGRYRIDRLLGEGAMGRVFKAYDPDLDRYVALKVLHGEGTEAGRVRLLREARAMARLGHPNVVTVHEVGTATGVDYVAMELVEGGTVDDWLSTPGLTRAAKLAALIDAGRGLAAAHAAGLVHRDFKPHNILRSNGGRIVVTDFGLARGEARLDPDDVPTGEGRDRDSADLASTLTNTGAMLGTPAYMAPEQYESSAVGPAADQFAFCVAVWEALAGKRPFSGPTLYEQRLAIDRGPDPVTQARIPRRLRAVLRRGLLVDPAARWPNMDALLAALRPRVVRTAIAAGVALAIGGALAVWLLSDRPAPAPGCDNVDTELAAFRTHPARAMLEGRGDAGREMLAALDRYAADWETVQRETCNGDAADRAARIACLLVVRDELVNSVDVAAHVTLDVRDVDILYAVGDPLACRAAPTRIGSPNDARSLAIARWFADDLPVSRWPAESESDPPCTRAAWMLARATQVAFEGDRMSALRMVAEHTERCGDDRLRAMVAVIIAEWSVSNPFGLPAALRRAQIAVERSGDDRMLDGRLRSVRSSVLVIEGELDAAIALAVSAIDLLSGIGAWTAVVTTTSTVVDLLRTRGTTEDFALAERLLREAIPHAGPSTQSGLSWRLAMSVWHQGRLDEAHRIAREIDPVQDPDGITVRGRVVDSSGKPIAKARVVAAKAIVGDSRSISIAPDRQTTSDAAGAFMLDGVTDSALVAAEHGSLRSMPAIATKAPIELELHPTGSVTGRVVRRGGRHPGGGKHNDVNVEVNATPREMIRAPWTVKAVVAPDGTFRIDGVIRGAACIVASWGTIQQLQTTHNVVVGDVPIGPIEIPVVNTGVAITAIVSSEFEGRLQGALVWFVAGRVSPATVGELAMMPTTMVRRWAHAPDDKVRATLGAKPSDLVATAQGLAPGEVTVCAILLGDLDDAAYAVRLRRHGDKLPLTCVTRTIEVVPDDPSARTIMVNVAPMKRLPDDP